MDGLVTNTGRGRERERQRETERRARAHTHTHTVGPGYIEFGQTKSFLSFKCGLFQQTNKVASKPKKLSHVRAEKKEARPVAWP